MQRSNKRSRALAVAAASLCVGMSFSFGAVHAQVPAESSLPQQTPAQEPSSPNATLPPAAGASATATVDDKKLDQFADAYLVIEKIQLNAATELKDTADAQQANEVKAKAEAQAIQAVEQTGLQLAEFNQIAELMMVDTTLRTKIVERVEQRRRT